MPFDNAKNTLNMRAYMGIGPMALEDLPSLRYT